MSIWYKFNKIMSIIVLALSICAVIVTSIFTFISAEKISGFGSSAGELIFSGILTLLLGLAISVGLFAAWNMLIDWYAKSTLGKTLPSPVQYGMPMQQQYTYPQPPKAQPAGLWQCPYCGTPNDMNSGFCNNCGKPKQ